MLRPLTFFNLDLHISVIGDIKHIFENLGHKINNWSISGHHELMGWREHRSCVVNARNWTQLDRKMCDKFYETYKNHPDLREADAFIITHTPSFAMLYERFEKPIIVVCSTRYEAPFTGNMLNWATLNRYLTKGVANGHIHMVANNHYDRKYLKHFTNLNAAYIPSLCEYTGARYTGIKDYALWDSRWIPDLPRELVRRKDQELKRGYSWQDVADHKAMIHVPYNASTMSIFEQYTANIPLVFPTAAYMARLMEEYPNQVLSELSYNKVFGLNPGSVLPMGSFNDPNQYSNHDVMKQWMLLADFYDKTNMPHLQYFSNLDDLERIFEEVDFDAVSSLMAEHNVKRRADVYAAWHILTANL